MKSTSLNRSDLIGIVVTLVVLFLLAAVPPDPSKSADEAALRICDVYKIVTDDAGKRHCGPPPSGTQIRRPDN